MKDHSRPFYCLPQSCVGDAKLGMCPGISLDKKIYKALGCGPLVAGPWAARWTADRGPALSKTQSTAV